MVNRELLRRFKSAVRLQSRCIARQRATVQSPNFSRLPFYLAWE
jgi:hypothetical protein